MAYQRQSSANNRLSSRASVSLTASKVAAVVLLIFLIDFVRRPAGPNDAEPGSTTRDLLIEGKDSLQLKKENLFEVWKANPETCDQWISMQRSARAYLDAYLIGAQKTSTSEMSTRMYALGILHKFMRKEWQFLNTLRDPTHEPYRKVELHRPYGAPDVASIRVPHFLSGFPHLERNITRDEDIPPIDSSPREQRKIIYDATVEYMLSDRVAFLASLLNPHARILMSMREPISRGLSQYNMVVRTTNENSESTGAEKISSTAKEFDMFVRREMKLLKTCGYDQTTGNLDRTTSKLLKCMLPEDPKNYHRWDRLYVTRGLYHIHIQEWRRFFPDHRMQFIRFGDVTNGDAETMQNLAKFLCVREYPENLLQVYKEKASNVSFGVQAAKLGVEKWRGFDSYEGQNKYLTEILDSTRAALEEFYRPSNARLFAMMGKKMY